VDQYLLALSEAEIEPLPLELAPLVGPILMLLTKAACERFNESPFALLDAWLARMNSIV